MQRIDDGRCSRSEIHSHTLVWAVVPKGSSLLLEDDEVPNSQERVLRNSEVEELSTGKGAEWAELAG